MLRFAQRSILRAALALLAITNLLESPPARAQHLGDVSLTTTTQILANGVSCTGNPQNFFPANLGQSFHLATAAITSGASSFGMEVDGIDAVNDVFKISNPMITVGTQSFLVQGTGFMPIIRVSLVCTLGSTFSMSYSGSFASNTIANVGAAGSGGALTTVGGNVQGIVPQGQNGFPIFPLIGGYVRPPINAGTARLGLDTFGQTSLPTTSGLTTVVTLRPPIVPSAPGGFGLAVLGDDHNAIISSLLGPWQCITGSCVGGGPDFATLALGTNNNLSFSLTNSGNGPMVADFIFFSNIPTVRQQNSGNLIVSISTPSNTLAGSTVVFAVMCTATTACVISPTDSQGNTLRQVGTTIPFSPGTGALSTWILGPTSAAAEVVTFNAAAGSTLAASAIVELTGLVPANPTTPSNPLTGSNPKFSTSEDDNGGLFIEAGGFDYTQTVTFSSAGTFPFPLWAQAQHGELFSCVLSERVTNITGTGTTLNTFLQDSADNIGFNDRLSMTQATTVLGAQNLLGAVSGGVGGITPAVATNLTLAAGSKVDGPLGPFGQIAFVVAGATPSVTVTYNVACR